MDERRLEIAISHLLRAGVMLSGALLVAGWASGGEAATRLMMLGIQVLMATPVVRVAATVVLFLHQGSRGYALIASLVLVILAIGILSGLEL